MYCEDTAKVAPYDLKRGTASNIRSLMPHHKKGTFCRGLYELSIREGDLSVGQVLLGANSFSASRLARRMAK